jgi:SAM-dependent methyltransferase
MAIAAVDFAKRVYRTIRGVGQDNGSNGRRARVEEILSRPEPPRPSESEELFRQLQREYQNNTPGDGYKYDPFSLWSRGVDRVRNLIPIAGVHSPGARILEVGCGDGMVGHALAAYGHKVTLTDVEDWRDGRAKGLPFVEQNITSPLPLEADSFDVVCSYNAFMHFEDPAGALTEMARLCRKGGIIRLEFGPLYPSPWGLMAYRTIRMPFPQYLLSDPFLEAKLQEFGHNVWPANLGRKKDSVVPLSGWKLDQYEQLWKNSGCEIVTSQTTVSESDLELIERFPQAFCGRGLTYRDVTTRLLAVTLKKP